jgi:hypothetical protein
VVERDENESDIFPVENELYALKLQTSKKNLKMMKVEILQTQCI